MLLIVLGLLPWLGACDSDAPPSSSSGAPSPDSSAVEELPRESLAVRITGNDFRWYIQYPGPDGQLDTADDHHTKRHLRLPMQTEIELELCSDDYVYSLYLPAFDLVEMAFPGEPFLLKFRTDSAETSRLMGAQMCGYAHDELLGDLIVVDREEFRAWRPE